MDERILNRLAEKFENVLEKPGGKGYKYVKSEDVFDRMNKVFKGNWNTEVLHQSVVDDQVLVRVRVMAQDPTSPDSTMFFHEAFASSQIQKFSGGPNVGKPIDIGNSYMGAMSKAVRGACKKWGVALDLEDEDTVATPGVPTSPSIPTFNIPTQPAPAPAPTKTEVAAPVLTAPTAPTPPPAGAPVAPPVTPTPPPVMKKPETLPTTPAPMPATPSMPQETNGNGGGKITDVQKIALQGLLTLRGLEYTKLATDAFASKNIVRDPLPQPEDLDYDDAVIVIKYGNDLFRKNK